MITVLLRVLGFSHPIFNWKMLPSPVQPHHIFLLINRHSPNLSGNNGELHCRIIPRMRHGIVARIGIPSTIPNFTQSVCRTRRRSFI